MKILNTIRTGWVLIIFIASLFLFLPVYLFSFLVFRHKRAKKTYWLTKIWGQLLLFAANIRIRMHPKKYFCKGCNYIFISNHRSLLDIIVCNAAIKETFQFLAKEELTRIPVFGYIIRNISLQVDRKSIQSKKSSFEALRKIIKAGDSVLLYPEGTRNNSGQLMKPFLNGAFRLAFETGTPVIVLTIWNTSNHFNSSFQLTPGIIDFFISEPLYPEKYSSIGELKAESQNIMLKNIESIQKKKI